MTPSGYDLVELFRTDAPGSGQPLIETSSFSRRCVRKNNSEILIDTFAPYGACCAFLRTDPGDSLTLTLAGNYRIAACKGGGWLLKPATSAHDTFWLPQAAHLRQPDANGHILAHSPARITDFDVSADSIAVTFDVPEQRVLDLAIWRFPPRRADLADGLDSLEQIERQPFFLWSSHTRFQRPADLYHHLIHGNVYENHEVWPRYWRVCSELDAYALYVTFTGLLRSTGKALYELLRHQLVLSVLSRQAPDGGWYHGEWSDDMESHYRLHAAAIHLLSAYLLEYRDTAVLTSLQRAASFSAARIDNLDIGPWYLHDSLESDASTIKKYPFRFQVSRALGKAHHNLLVLNTHLDTNIAMEQARRASGDERHGDQIKASHATSHAVCTLRPAEWLYRPLFKAISLTFLPSGRGAALPLPLRALKRLAWKYLVPQLPRLKALFPRLVMPGGYIERDLAQKSSSVRYQPVNLMDLARTRHVFSDSRFDSLIDESFAFTQSSGLRERWRELKGKEDDSLGFWTEALYHLCIARPEFTFRKWLAESMIDATDAGIGLSPSVLGGNAEAVPPPMQTACPWPVDERLLVANLSRSPQRQEWLIVNPDRSARAVIWRTPPPQTQIVWRSSSGQHEQDSSALTSVPARGWLHASTHEDFKTTRESVENP